MKVLLLGEFSRLHNSLREGLVALGHEVVLLGTGDDFKDFPVDLSIKPITVQNSAVLRLAGKIMRRVTGTDLEMYEKARRFRKLLPALQGFDVVQLINSDAIETLPALEIQLYEQLFRQNKKKFLLVCGDETPVIDQQLENELPYSVLTPYFEEKSNAKYYGYSLKYTTPPYRKLYDFVAANVNGILTSDLDYKIPLDLAGINNTMIPNPVNTEKIKFGGVTEKDKIVIFHGINKYSFVKKGSRFFEEALQQITAKYGKTVKVITANSLPYEQYSKLQQEADIVLDQVYCFDQGYNALEAMARGKVVFTGADKAFVDFYGLNRNVAVNALPDVNYLVEWLSFFIENPQEIRELGLRARAFIEQHHDYKKVAQQYIETWSKA